MTPELKQKWIADLRTAQQAHSRLHNGQGGYCCLGRLCSVLGAEFVYNEPHNTWVPRLDGVTLADGEGLSVEAMGMAGLTYAQQTRLIEINDHNHGFEPVIAWIEENL